MGFITFGLGSLFGQYFSSKILISSQAKQQEIILRNLKYFYLICHKDFYTSERTNSIHCPTSNLRQNWVMSITNISQS